jgi:putative transposase
LHTIPVSRQHAGRKMRRSHFTDDEILRLLREAAEGVGIAEICRTAGISQRTFYRWRERFAGMTTPELSKFRELQMENRRLRQVLEHFVHSPGLVAERGARQAPPPIARRPTSRGNMGCYPFLRVRP